VRISALRGDELIELTLTGKSNQSSIGVDRNEPK
jgi:hypothetical protein